MNRHKLGRSAIAQGLSWSPNMDSEIDFINFGVLRNEPLLARVNAVLRDIHLYGFP